MKNFMKKIVNWFNGLSKRGKIIVSVIVIAIMFVSWVSTKQETAPTAKDNQQPQTSVIQIENPSSTSYDIKTVNDFSLGNTVRKDLRVTISEEDMNNLSDEEIENLLKTIIVNYVNTHDYVKAVSVLLYCEGDRTDSIYTIAKADFAPDGDWSKASEGVNGNYEGYDYLIDIRSQSDRETLRELNK